MIDFLKSKKFKIIIAIVAILFGMMLYSASSEGIENIPKNFLSIISTPFQKATASVANATGEFFDQFLNASNNKKENEFLKKSIDELNQKLVDYEELKDENEQLKQIAGIKKQYPGFEMTSAFVIGRDPADRYGSFTIDKGTLHGIKLNDPVITSSGLIGIVSDISQISARVKTILSPEVKVSALEITSKELGFLTGEVKLSQKGLCKLSILGQDSKIKTGDIIVSAGASGTFPKGVPLGKVKSILDEAHGITMYATIEPMEKIDKVSNVQIVTNFLGQGSNLSDYLK